MPLVGQWWPYRVLLSGKMSTGCLILKHIKLMYVGEIGYSLIISFHTLKGGPRVVTLSPLTSDARVRFMALPQVGKLVVACRWLAVYSTEP